jgi:VWFA-related protein
MAAAARPVLAGLRCGHRRVAWLAGALAVAAAASLYGQASPSPPSFPAQAEAITVDVVVLDRDGQPVAGLTKEDFTLLDGGRPQAIVGFEERRAPTGAETRAAATDAVPERVVSNIRRGDARGRVLVILIDDLGLTATTAQQLGPALARWIREKADPSDEITIQTSSGDLWWSAEAGDGRGDLVAVLDRLRGKKAPPPSTEWISEVEAYQIVVHESRLQAADLDSPTGDRADITIGPSEPSPPPILGANATVVDRVANRLLEAHSCVLLRSPRPVMFQCKQLAVTLAEHAYGQWTRRAGAVLDLVRRVSTDMAGTPGRKSVLVVSDELLRDLSMEVKFRDVVAAAQRSNTSLYFSRASGLTGPSSYSAAGGGIAHPSDMGALEVEETQLAVAGGDHLADETGGASITTSNDLAAGLTRMARDASSYYLLGYQPERAPDGKWHRLQVKVGRPGLEVRARRGYVATAAATAPVSTERAPAGGKKDAPRLPALSAAAHDQIPLRVASYLKSPDGAGGATVLMVIEVDGDRVRTAEAAGSEVARLEMSILAVSRDQPKVLPLAQTVEMKLRPQDKGWWAFFREVRLPPGVAQLRVRVRDTASGAQGAVAQRIEIPDVEAPYLSTPFLADATQPPREKGEPPQLVPTARRTFAARGTLYCQYELFMFGGRDLPGVPRVTGSYTLSRVNGEAVASAPPTLIGGDGTRIVRRLSWPLAGLAPGAYDLVLTVEDHLANRTFTSRERFEVTAPLS